MSIQKTRNILIFCASGIVEQKHHERKQWIPQKNLESGTKNVLRQKFIDLTNIALPPLPITLDMMKQFVKALDFRE